MDMFTKVTVGFACQKYENNTKGKYVSTIFQYLFRDLIKKAPKAKKVIFVGSGTGSI